jgi:HSP20 family protein
MSNLTRWEPVHDFLSLQDAMDKLFDEMITQPGGISPLEQIVPALDMYQTANEIVIKASLPGLNAEDMDISIAGDVLTIKGELLKETEDSKATYHIRERRWGSFTRSINLPAPVVADKAKAEFENGVLKLTLPKAEEVQAKVITIKTK